MTEISQRTADERTTAAVHRSAAASLDPAERARQMSDLHIGFDGRHYGYNGYRYDHFTDAVAYARLMHARPTQGDAGGPFRSAQPLVAPTDAERGLMVQLGIAFDDGRYRFEGFRYDGLQDAVNYAHLTVKRREQHRSALPMMGLR
jgi:hypothetical protein